MVGSSRTTRRIPMSRELVGGRIRRACRDRAQRGFHAGLPRQGLRRCAASSPATAWSTTRPTAPIRRATRTRGKDRLQAFTAIGTVKQGKPYQADMGPWLPSLPPRRRLARGGVDADRGAAGSARLHPGRRTGAIACARVVVEISEADMTAIAEAMFTAAAAPGRLAA